MQAFHQDIARTNKYGVTIDIEGTQNCKWRNFPQEFSSFLWFSFFGPPYLQESVSLLKGNFLKQLKISQAFRKKTLWQFLYFSNIFFWELCWNFFKNTSTSNFWSCRKTSWRCSSPPLKALDKEKELLKPFSLAKKLGEWELGRGERLFWHFCWKLVGLWNLLYLVGNDIYIIIIYIFMVIPGNSAGDLFGMVTVSDPNSRGH